MKAVSVGDDLELDMSDGKIDVKVMSAHHDGESNAKGMKNNAENKER